jgi:hypothetical protein
MRKRQLLKLLNDRKEMFEKYLQNLKPADGKKRPQKPKAGRAG